MYINKYIHTYMFYFLYPFIYRQIIDLPSGRECMWRQCHKLKPETGSEKTEVNQTTRPLMLPRVHPKHSEADRGEEKLSFQRQP